MVMEKGETDLHKILQTYTSDIPLYRLLRYWYEMLLAVEFIHKVRIKEVFIFILRKYSDNY